MGFVYLVVAPAAWCAFSACAPEPRAAAAAVRGVDSTIPHGDHTPRYGGIVLMHGDLHFEVVLSRSGRYRLYFSDATRAELPAAVAASVTFTVAGDTIDARVDEAGESWFGEGRALRESEATARVSFVTDAGPYWIDVPLTGAKP
jgi:hypothetical protein